MPVMHVSNATVEEISRDRGNTLVTVIYREEMGSRRNEERVRLVVGSNTLILNRNGIPVPARELQVGMTVDAAFSSAMTRSIPPQAQAYLIRIVRTRQQESVVTGRVLEVDQRNQQFTTIRERDVSSIIRFNVSNDTRFFDRQGRPMNFSRLSPGMRVRVRHADFMTASIPPQTTAIEVRVI